ncbi:MAG: PorT family protein [Bacteroidales bacterium]|nr:PorT family protein [Bacteroidales bacterium]
MKVKRTFLALALALSMGAGASAQEIWEFGIKGGIALNMMPMTTVTPYDKYQPNFGFQGGAFACAYLSDSVMGQVELLYSRKGVSTINHAGEVAFGGGTLNYTRNIHYLQIPVLIGFHSMGNDRMKVMIGPEFNICLGNEIRANYFDPAFDNADYEVNKFNLGLGLQVTYFFIDALGMDFKVDYGLTKTFKSSTGDKGHNAAIQLGLCYRFGY